MDHVDQRTVDAITAKLLGDVYPGLRCRFKDGYYTVVTRGALEMRDFGRVRIQWWVTRRDDGYTTTYSERTLLSHRV